MYAYLSPVGPDLWDVTLPALFSSTVRVDISMGEPTRVIEAGGREPFQPEAREILIGLLKCLRK